MFTQNLALEDSLFLLPAPFQKYVFIWLMIFDDIILLSLALGMYL